MRNWMHFVRLVVAMAASFAGSSLLFAQATATDDRETKKPFGISSSASALRNTGEWFPKIQEAGCSSVRFFPEWNGVEPVKGTWKWDRADELLKSATEHRLEVTAVLMGSPPGSKKSHAFPMSDLAGWSPFVERSVERYKDRIHHWEVWNEGNGGFNDDHHTTTDYAKLALATYAAAKKANAKAQVGLSVASFDAPYLQKAIEAMAAEGKGESFDYLCIHPYEVADGLADPHGELPFLWMSRMTRDMLKKAAPKKADAPIWITEVGRRIGNHGGRPTGELEAAADLTKIYTLAIAQGIARTQWFEGQDPIGEDAGFGLIDREGKPRASYRAFKTLATNLGPSPNYLGWLAIGKQGRGYGFVVEGKAGPLLICWMPRGEIEKDFGFDSDVAMIGSLDGAESMLKAVTRISLVSSPRIFGNLPRELVAEAKANAAKDFPWGGNFAKADVVACSPGSIEPATGGVIQTNPNATPTIKFADGSTGILVRGDQGVNFYAHPSFANLQTRDFHVRVTVRRVAPGNLGMNCWYPAADGQGRTPYKNREIWFGATASNDWQTFTWHITDAALSKMWGYDIGIRPEQSVPFVIGKVEVSKVPFAK